MISGAVNVSTATIHFQCPQVLLARLSIQEAKHKINPPSQVLDSLGLHFTSHDMTVSLTPKKLTEVRTLVVDWSAKRSATLHELQSLLGKLLYIA